MRLENDYYIEIKILDKDKNEIYHTTKSEAHIKNFKKMYKCDAIKSEINQVLRKNKLKML